MYSGQRFDSFRAAVSGNLTPNPHFPEILFGKSVEEGNIVKFFEESFEWKNATYSFYPYFWGRKEQWVQRQSFADSDPVFQSFLQAGYARMLVPVTPGMERLVMLFGWRPELALQQGASSVRALGVQNPLYTALATELYHAHRIVKAEDAPIIDTYVEKVPTNLVYLVNELEVGESLKLPELPKFATLIAATLSPDSAAGSITIARLNFDSISPIIALGHCRYIKLAFHLLLATLRDSLCILWTFQQIPHQLSQRVDGSKGSQVPCLVILNKLRQPTHREGEDRHAHCPGFQQREWHSFRFARQ